MVRRALISPRENSVYRNRNWVSNRSIKKISVERNIPRTKRERETERYSSVENVITNVSFASKFSTTFLTTGCRWSTVVRSGV